MTRDACAGSKRCGLRVPSGEIAWATSGLRWTRASGRASSLPSSIASRGASTASVPVRELSLTVLRGDRVGLIGPTAQASRRSLKLILGVLPPSEGTVRLGTRLQVAYFDQLRAALDPQRTLQETIAPGSDWVETAGGRRHVLSYLGDFLFPPERAQAPVATLSGGERNRLLLARLFAQPANLLVLDEPTNDLDIESLELLEATLQGYGGTLLLVSHDRRFLDNVVTQTLVAEGEGRWQEYAGGYSDWLMQRPTPAVPAAGSPPGKPVAAPEAETREGNRKRERVKLSFKEQRELDALPAELEALEQEQHALTAKLSAPDYHRQDVATIKADRARAEAIEHRLAERFARWAELDAKARGGGAWIEPALRRPQRSNSRPRRGDNEHERRCVRGIHDRRPVSCEAPLVRPRRIAAFNGRRRGAAARQLRRSLPAST